MILKRISVLLLVITTISLLSCGEYSKVLKSTDYDYKFEKAEEYYNNDQFVKAIPLFEELIALFRGTNRAEKSYYLFAYCHYYIGDFYLANYYFKNFTKTFPASKKAEECLFMSAICSQKNSPNYSLDQTSTLAAVDELQLFVDRYPESKFVDSCNQLIDGMRSKLELKQFEMCKLYHRTEDYQSAVVAFRLFLKDFPSTSYKEEALFLSLESNFRLALNSVEQKKEERLRETLKSYRTFVDSFKESRHSREAESIYKNTNKELEQYQ